MRDVQVPLHLSDKKSFVFNYCNLKKYIYR